MPDFVLSPFSEQDRQDLILNGSLGRTAEGLRLSFRLEGTLAGLVLPPLTLTGRKDNLWQSTCFEMFWAVAGEKNYWELNLSPAGEWNLYAFADYRKEMREEKRIAGPTIRTEKTDCLFSIGTELDLSGLAMATAPLRVGISAVLAYPNNRLSYWALSHPEQRPDFHSRKGFVLGV